MTTPTVNPGAGVPGSDPGAGGEVAPSCGAGNPPGFWRAWGRWGVSFGVVGLGWVVWGAWYDWSAWWPGVPGQAQRYAIIVFTVVFAWMVEAGWRFVRNAHGRDCPWCGGPKLAAALKDALRANAKHRKRLDHARQDAARLQHDLADARQQAVSNLQQAVLTQEEYIKLLGTTRLQAEQLVVSARTIRGFVAMHAVCRAEHLRGPGPVSTGTPAATEPPRSIP